MNDTQDNEVITIRLKDLQDLEDDVAFLRALEAAGVDNWEGWDMAVEIYNGNR